MARPLRVQYPGVLYHVTARRNERKTIFRSDADRERFLAVLAHAPVTPLRLDAPQARAQLHVRRERRRGTHRRVRRGRRVFFALEDVRLLSRERGR